ncbi:hypothetical protein N9M41_05925 [Rhodopirellula sp.]|nr:hypothetical protein [Rhodopirellula sp.]
MKSDEAKRLRELEIENQRLKEMLAEAELDKRILKTALARRIRCVLKQLPDRTTRICLNVCPKH